MSWRAWLNELEYYERAEAVAHYRTHLLIEAHLNDAAEKAAERKSRTRAATKR